MDRHEFQLFAFHPKKADILVCLNYNKHPLDLENYTIDAAEQSIWRKQSIKPSTTAWTEQRPRLSNFVSDHLRNMLQVQGQDHSKQRISGFLGDQLGLRAQKQTAEKKHPLESGTELNQVVESQVEQQSPSEDSGSEPAFKQKFQTVMTIKTNTSKLCLQNTQKFTLKQIEDFSFQGEISITEWDLRNRYISKISETQIQGTNAFLMKFSNDGTKLFVLYEKADQNQTILSNHNENTYVQFLSIFDSEYMTLLKQGQLGAETECFEDIYLLWKGTFIYAFDLLQQNSSCAHKFYKIKPEDYRDPEEDTGSLTQFTYQLEGHQKFNILEDQLCFDDAQEGKVFTIRIFQGDNEGKEGEMTQPNNMAHWTVIDIMAQNKEDMVFMFQCKQINAVTNLVLNKECTHAFFQDRETKTMSVVLDLEKQRVVYFHNLASELVLRPNSFLYKEFVGVYEDFDMQRYIFNASTEFKKKSECKEKGCYFDINQRLNNNNQLSMAEVSNSISDSDLLKVSIYQGSQVLTSELKEFQNMIIKYPYVIVNKGNHRLMLRNLHLEKFQAAVELEQSENFMCFIEFHPKLIDQDQMDFYQDTNQSLDRSVDLTEEEEEDEDGNIIPKEDEIHFNYVSSSKKGFTVNSIKMTPYSKNRQHTVEHKQLSKELKFTDFKSREIIQAHLIQIQSFQDQKSRKMNKLNVGQEKGKIFAIVIQYKDNISVKGLNCDFNFISSGTKPLKFQISDYLSEKDGLQELFFISKDTSSNKINLLSFKDKKSPNPLQVLIEEASEILSVMLKEQLFFYLDETMRIRVLQVKRKEGEKSSLEQKFFLNCTTQTRDDLIANKEMLLKPYHEAFISSDYCLHVSNRFYRFFQDQNQLQHCQQEEDLYYLNSQVDETHKNIIMGPLSDTQSSQQLGYLYQKKQHNILIYKKLMDTRTNLLIKGRCDFATILDPEILLKPRDFVAILVLMKGQFKLFAQNGTILQENIEIEKFEKQKELGVQVEIVSRNQRYFVFEGSNTVHKLVLRANEELRFEYDSKFSLGVKHAEDVIKIQKRYILENKKIQLKIDPAFTPDNMEIQEQSELIHGVPQEDFQNHARKLFEKRKIKENLNQVATDRLEEDDFDPTFKFLPSEEEEHKSGGYNTISNDSKEVSIDPNKQEKPRKIFHIRGSIQISHDGVVWNLFYDEDKEKLYLKAGQKVIKTKCIPKELVERIKKKPKTQILMILLHGYVVLAPWTKKSEIWYIQLDTEVPILIKGHKKPIKLDLDLTKTGWNLKQIRPVNANDRVLLQLAHEDTEQQCVLVWNLERNMEDRMMELDSQKALLLQGVNSSLGYVHSNQKLYEIEYMFSLKHFGQLQDRKYIMNNQEFALSYNKDHLLLRTDKEVTLTTSITEIENRFLSKFDQYRSILKRKPFPITMIQFRTKEFGESIFHLLLEDFKALKKFCFNYIRYVESFEDEDDRVPLNEIFLQIVYPQHNTETPFDLAMKKSSQYVDFFLKILVNLQNYKLSKFLFKDLRVFAQLMDMGLPSFDQFLDTCFFTTSSMQVQVRHWKHGKKEYALSQLNHSLIDDEYLSEFIGLTQEEGKKFDKNVDPSLNSQIQKVMKKTYFRDDSFRDSAFGNLRRRATNFYSQKMQSGLRSLREKHKFPGLDCKIDHNYNREIEEKLGEVKRCEVKAIEFDWIFISSESFLFIEELVTTENDGIFEVETIRHCVDFLWKFYFKRIFQAVFLPQVLYFSAFIVYSVFFYDGTLNKDKKFTWNYLLGSLICARGLYNTYLQFRLINKSGKKYFRSTSAVWGLLDLIACSLIIWFTLNDFLGGPVERGRVIGSVAIMLLWVKFFYFLRIFQQTAAFIRMITEIVRDMAVFSFIFLLGIVTFSNAFYMLDGATTDLIKDRVAGDTWFQTMIYVYINSLGELDTDGFMESDHTVALYMFWLGITIAIQIILLNLLIAIMGDTFDKVQEKKEQARIKENCALIYENWFWLDRRETFKKTKYIIVAQQESASDKKVKSWEGKLAFLKSHIVKQINSVNETIKVSKDQSREEGQSMHKQILQGMSQMQKNFSLLLHQTQTELRKLKYQKGSRSGH